MSAVRGVSVRKDEGAPLDPAVVNGWYENLAGVGVRVGLEGVGPLATL
jgi:hypothetical protein